MTLKIWTVATDTEMGTESHTFNTEAEFNDFMHGFLAERWHSDDDMPDDWNAAWEAMGEALGDLDTFTCGETDLSDHPLVLEAIVGLRLGIERMEMNNYDKEEDPFVLEVEEIIAKLEPPQRPAQAAA